MAFAQSDNQLILVFEDGHHEVLKKQEARTISNGSDVMSEMAVMYSTMK